MSNKSSDGTPYELKGSRTVWNGGKAGDCIKRLPIVIINFLGVCSRLTRVVEEVGELVKLKNVDSSI